MLLVRFALFDAGFWNVSHNDILLITPRLVEKFESITGKVIKRKNSKAVSFPAKDQQAVVEAVAAVMAEYLPEYGRAEGF